MNSILSLSNLEFLGSWWLLGEWVIRLISLYIVPKNRKPSSGMAWLLLIFFFPSFGMIIFLILGNPKLPKARRNAQKTLNDLISQTVKKLKVSHLDKKGLEVKVPLKYEQISKLSESLSKLPPFGGNKIDILDDYEGVINSIVADLDKAKIYIHLEYFIISMDSLTLPIFDALKRAVDRGVIVRVMYDSFSTKKYNGYRKMIKRMALDGVFVQEMLPLRLPGRGYVRPDLRNHRKIVIVDGKIGYSGSQNLIQRNYHRDDDIYYDELVARIHGPVVLELDAIFLTDWFSETGKLLDYETYADISIDNSTIGNSTAQILPSGPGYEDENNLKIFTSLIYQATERIVLVNPYFVPDDSLLIAITSAAKRGVEVILINSQAEDQWLVAHAQRSFYEILLKAGVKIFRYKAPILLHSKFITIDGEVATIGSSNLDIRSFELDLEITVIIYDPKVVEKLIIIENKYLKKSDQLSLAEWKKRPRHKILFDNIARLTASLQ
ncbi:MAG: cardiolipin synthase [Candidatus Saccharibacteria bacterium]